MIITANDLPCAATCSSQVAIFRAEWPDGCEVTEAACLRAMALGLDLWWAAENLLTPGQQGVYRAAHDDAWRVYETACVEAWRVYQDSTDDPWRVRDAATAAAWRVYWDASHDAWLVYREATARAFAAAWVS